MWTYLQLVQRLRSESRMAGTGPATVVGQAGDSLRLCNWIADAWFDIQAEHPDLKFLRLTAEWATVDGQATYTPTQCGITSGTFGTWCREDDSFRVLHTATGDNSEIPLAYREYSNWRWLYQLGAMRTAKGHPTEYTVGPNDVIGLGLVPLAGYTVRGDYFRAPVRLAADADVPALPDKHSPMLIVYRAIKDYGYHFAAQEALARANEHYSVMEARLINDQLPELRLCGGLI